MNKKTESPTPTEENISRLDWNKYLNYLAKSSPVKGITLVIKDIRAEKLRKHIA